MHGIDSGPIVMVRRTLEEIHFTLRCRPAGGPHWLGEEDQGGRVLLSICQTVRKRDGITGMVRNRRWDRYELEIIGSNRGGGAVWKILSGNPTPAVDACITQGMVSEVVCWQWR